MSEPLTPAALVEAVARAMRDSLYPQMLPGRPWRDDADRDYWQHQARAALAAVLRVAFHEPEEATVQAAYATPPVAALLRALAGVSDDA
jgi:hypothetical protein